MRWQAARTLLALARLGLDEELLYLASNTNAQLHPSLSSEQFTFSGQNAMEWLLIGLARAARLEPDLTKCLREPLERLVGGPKPHVLHQTFAARALNSWAKGTNSENYLDRLPFAKLGEIKNGRTTEVRESLTEFRFDYEFDKYDVRYLADLFGISHGEAIDAIAAVIERNRSAVGERHRRRRS